MQKLLQRIGGFSGSRGLGKTQKIKTQRQTDHVAQSYSLAKKEKRVRKKITALNPTAPDDGFTDF